jgi:Ca2+-binding RTX toxin-like protein
VTFGATQIAGIEMLVLLTGGDNRFGNPAGTGYAYYITMDDANVAAGQTFYVSANTLKADVVGVTDETLIFDGAAETDGQFVIWSGAGDDTLHGGDGDDTIYGAGGADQMTGNAGNDVFAYIDASHSTSASRDVIDDFTTGDTIDLSAIDANTLLGGNDAFNFIGNAAFGGNAGELRFENVVANIWLVQGDTDGNSVADFELQITIPDAHPIIAADFVL